MDDRELYKQILGMNEPWVVARVGLERASGEIHVYCQGRRKTRPVAAGGKFLKAAVRKGWSGVWGRPWGGLRRSGGPSSQPAA